MIIISRDPTIVIIIIIHNTIIIILYSEHNQQIHIILLEKIYPCQVTQGSWFPTVLFQIENWNQKSQVTGQGYIYTQFVKSQNVSNLTIRLAEPHQDCRVEKDML